LESCLLLEIPLTPSLVHPGLQISSHIVEMEGRDPKLPPLLVTEFTPKAEHQSYAGVLNAGVVGSLLDCHGNWTTALALMSAAGCDKPPTVISAFHSIKLTKPVPYIEGSKVTISSVVEELLPDRAFVKMYLRTGDDATSRCAEGEGWCGLLFPFAVPRLSPSLLSHPLLRNPVSHHPRAPPSLGSCWSRMVVRPIRFTSIGRNERAP
jgi:hypothetical protein